MAERSLTRDQDWRRVQTEGARGRCDHLKIVIARRDPEELPSRLGLRIRSEGPARAVARNRCRRRVREAWSATVPAQGWDAIVSTSAQMLNGKTYQEVVSCLELAWEKALEAAR